MIGVLVQRHREQYVVVWHISFLGFYVFSYKVLLKVILYEKKVNFESILFPLISSF